MSSADNPFTCQREWMYHRIDRRTRCVREEFQRGCEYFVEVAKEFHLFPGNRIWCPCKKCMNQKKVEVNQVESHLYNKGFTPNYTVWTAHGEQLHNPPANEDGECSNEGFTQGVHHGEPSYNTGYPDGVEFSGDMDMQERVGDVHSPANHDMRHTMDEETASFFNALDSAKSPLYDQCVEGLSKFSVASDMLFCKTKHNVSEETFDDFSRIMKHILPRDNIVAANYYETEKVMRALGMPYIAIDVCQNNCMIYWSEADKYLLNCKFCDTPRYKPEKRSRSRRASIPARVPYKKMWYLPVTHRLKRMYLSNKTASQMRWHAEHVSADGKMQHPSDAKAWKHFNEVYPDFANNHRNVYLGLCTDGFNPFGLSGANYSLWPVMLTPYNLPPEMCMKREFLFLSLLVPGPNHPKRSLDIFLQPLIEELQTLWSVGVEAFDISVHQSFNLRAVLLWTISDYPAYGMLSGWTTHGRLSCPYCMADTDAFYLSHGKKICWFDCHRRFLPEDHDYRKNDRAFKKDVVMEKAAPPVLSGEDILNHHLEDIYGLQKTVDCGGNGHINEAIEGYLEDHNWHKFSIFWELPYWKTHLLRHNLDVMHIEKNFFDNIFNTIFNVIGKTKDTINSRKDLPEHCKRKRLHLTSMGRAPIPIYRLSGPAKTAFLKWLKHDVRFPDGYVSNIGRCINVEAGKIHGLKSHDCHVLMQRIFPFAFAELLSPAVHNAISDIALFFRDLCARTLTYDDVHRLKQNISQTLCNLEKIFPPSFFDVMEHLVVHLPLEAELGGPVQFRWMYPPERFMFHLKKMGKNKAHVEGSIVKAYDLEEISTFTSQYYTLLGTIMNDVRKPRHAAGYLQVTDYQYDVPELFRHVGSGSGESYYENLNDQDHHIAHTYILLNCPDLAPLERMYDAEVLHHDPRITPDQIRMLKQQRFSTWLMQTVRADYTNTIYPLWLHELAEGPIRSSLCWTKYFSRGYSFHTVSYGEHRATANYGVSVRGSSSDGEVYYGKLQQIIQIAYHGAVRLRVTLFRCDWFDTTPGTGTRMRKPGLVEVFANGTYEHYDPFILTTQADQVCFLAYPRLRAVGNEWLVVIKVRPRGIIDDSKSQLDAVQEDNNEHGHHHTVYNVDIDSLVMPGGRLEEVPNDPIIIEDDEYGSDVALTESTSESESDSE